MVPVVSCTSLIVRCYQRSSGKFIGRQEDNEIEIQQLLNAVGAIGIFLLVFFAPS